MRNFKLKMSLFRIWFVKNIVLFLEIIAIVLFILVLTGVLPESTPIFGPLIIEIREAEGDSSGWIKGLSITTTCLTSVGLFLAKVKSIALSDIKNDKLKLALVNANMYFNEKGKLTKKVEKATGTDIDGDGKVDEKETDEGVSNVRVATNLFTGIKDAISEFFAIATVRLDDDEKKAQKQAENIIKDHDMKQTVEALNELDDIKREALNMKVDRVVDETVNEAVGDTESNNKISEAEKKDRISIIKRFGEWCKKMFHIERKTPEEKVAIREAREKQKAAKKAAKENAKKERAAAKQLEAEKKAKAKKEKENKKSAEKPVIKEQKTVVKEEPKKTVVEDKPTKPSSGDSVNSFLAGLRSKQ